MLPATLLGASNPPAGGAATSDVIYATAGAMVVTVLLFGPVLLYKLGRFPALGRLADLAERVTKLPGWAALPGTFLAVTLLIAVFGMYWDISLHIDQGRDPGPLANPAHYFILAGLFGVLLAGVIGLALPKRATRTSYRDRARLVRADRRPDDRDLRRQLAARLPARRHLAPDLRPGRDPLGADPPDADRRRLALRARRLGPARRGRRGAPRARAGRCRAGPAFREIVLAGAFLVALSTFQAEFDFGVPQFALGLPADADHAGRRDRPGHGADPLRAAAARWRRSPSTSRSAAPLTLLIGPLFGEITPHFPPYVVEALVVEGVALAYLRGEPAAERPITFGALAGLAIGTVGLAAEWAWSHVWVVNPWPASLFPEGAITGLIAARRRRRDRRLHRPRADPGGAEP